MSFRIFLLAFFQYRIVKVLHAGKQQNAFIFCKEFKSLYILIKYYRNLLESLKAGTMLANMNSDEVSSEITLNRAIHLLVERCNDAIRSLLFWFLLTPGTAQVIAAVTIVHSTIINLLLLLLFAMTVLQTVMTIVVVYGFAGDFNKDSELSLLQLQKQASIQYDVNVGRKERKYRERFLRSCQVQKVKFGLSNFIEKSTPPLFQLYCLNRIIVMLLVC